jgi:hypothetical protein
MDTEHEWLKVALRFCWGETSIPSSSPRCWGTRAPRSHLTPTLMSFRICRIVPPAPCKRRFDDALQYGCSRLARSVLRANLALHEFDLQMNIFYEWSRGDSNP